MFKKVNEIEVQKEIRIKIFCQKCKKEHFADEDCEGKEGEEVIKRVIKPEKVVE